VIFFFFFFFFHYDKYLDQRKLMSRGTRVKTLCSPMSQHKINCVFCVRIGLITRKKVP
jgi:hypothetical protein